MKNSFLTTFQNLLRFSLSSKISFVLFLEIITSTIITLCMVAFFLTLGNTILEKQVFVYDATITHFFYMLRNQDLTRLMLWVTFFGGPVFLLSASSVFMLYLYIKKHKDALIFSAIFYCGILINLLLKNMFHRPRPNLIPLVYENTFSFPSGHAMNSFVFYMAFTYFILRETKNKKLTLFILIISAILIITIGTSRIYLGVHYPSDIIAGYIAGCIWLISAIIFEKLIIFERLYKMVKKQKKYAKKS